MKSKSWNTHEVVLDTQRGRSAQKKIQEPQFLIFPVTCETKEPLVMPQRTKGEAKLLMESSPTGSQLS